MFLGVSQSHSIPRGSSIPKILGPLPTKEWHGSGHQPHPHLHPTKISPSPPHLHQL